LSRRKLKRQWGILYWKERSIVWAEDTFIRLCKERAVEFAARHGLRAHV